MRSIEEVETRLRSLPASVELRPADDRALGEIHLWPRPDSPRRARPVAIRVIGGVAAAVIAILLIIVIASEPWRTLAWERSRSGFCPPSA